MVPILTHNAAYSIGKFAYFGEDTSEDNTIQHDRSKYHKVVEVRTGQLHYPIMKNMHVQ